MNKLMMNCIYFIFGFLFLFTACSTDYNTLMKNSETEFYKGNYMDAARKLLPYVNKTDNNQLLFMMECGLMLHTAGEYEKSNTVLLGAAKLADTIATSVSKKAVALLLNETKTNYKGEDFEVVLIHMYLGINYLMLKDADNAKGEFKKVNDLLREINTISGKDYKQNIMAKYLTAIAFELTADKSNDSNDTEFAYIEYKQIHELDPKLDIIYKDLQRLSRSLGDTDDFNKWTAESGKKYNPPKDAGEVIVFFQAGRGAIKESRGHLLDDTNMKNSITVSLIAMPMKAGITIAGVLIALKIAENPIPVFHKRSDKIRELVININGTDLGGTILLENIENTAIKNMQDNYSKMYRDVAAGIAVKAVASLSVGLGAREIAKQSKELKQFAGIIGAIAGAGTGAALASQIKPDLRCWHTLPANLQVGRFFLTPGIYDISVKYIDQSGNIEQTKTVKVEVKKGEKSFLNYRTLY